MADLMLEGIRVLDLSQYLPGPYAGQMLADLGADVVKVEPPAGDPMRRLGGVDSDGLAPAYKLVNAGKTIVHLDLKGQEDRAAFERLVERADVLVESFRPGTLDKLGFPRSRLDEINPGLVHVALSGWGQGGPYRLRAGHDLNYMALGGGLGGVGHRRNSRHELSAGSRSLRRHPGRRRRVGRAFPPGTDGQGRLSRHQPDGNGARLAILAADHGASRSSLPGLGRTC